jgi:hypothetical protein
MASTVNTFPRTAVFTAWRSFAVASIALVLVAVSGTVDRESIDFYILGTLLSAVLGVSSECLARATRGTTPSGVPLLETPIQLASDERIFAAYEELSRWLLAISHHRDPIYRGLALDELARLSDRLQQIACGTLTFEDTETWRIVYESLLRSPGLHLYRSVAWVKDRRYWQDEPGRKSMAVNFELQAAGRVTIERIAIIGDELWPETEPLPDERVHLWIREQHEQGIAIGLVRESALTSEPDLIADLGIYGFRAVGTQQLGDACRTVRFTLTFDTNRVKEAEARWQRLSVYAVPYAAWLDQIELPL